MLQVIGNYLGIIIVRFRNMISDEKPFQYTGIDLKMQAKNDSPHRKLAGSEILAYNGL